MLPEIQLSEIQEKAKQEDPMEFLFVFINAYIDLERQGADLTVSQRSLLAFNDMFRGIFNGGSIQLIMNGCGERVFLSPLAESLEKWGAYNIADIVRKGKRGNFGKYSARIYGNTRRYCRYSGISSKR